MSIYNIPDDIKTLVVTTTLLFGEKSDKKVFDRIEQFYLSQKMDKNIDNSNLVFGILGDMVDSSEAVNEKDSAVISYAEDRINSLNKKYNGAFYLFIRKRVWCETEKRYLGRDRKRGAVTDLIRAVCGKPNEFSVLLGDKKYLTSVKYVITLDADTDFGIADAYSMTAAMCHNSNKPVIKNGRVVSGYAIMQPRMDTSLTAAFASPFTVMMCGGGGFDIYSSAAFDLYQSVFGEGIFCGKGIIDAHVYYKLLNDTFPEEKILSHDILEGGYLRAGFLSDLALTDSFPKTPVSYFDRLHRWIRGDIQAIFFAKKPLNKLSVYKLYDNIRRASVPVFSFFLLIISVLYKNLYTDYNSVPVVFASVLYIIYPFIEALFKLTKYSGRRFFSNLVPGIWHSLCYTLYSLASLGYLAIRTFDAMIRSLYRVVISKKNLLQWVTASESDNIKRGGLLYYHIRMLPSFLLGILFLFSKLGFIRFLGILWFLCPISSYFLGKDYIRNKKISNKNKEYLKSHAVDMWRYFSSLVNENENHLPPDNYQFSPSDEIAHRTSPTNIGLYLLSCLSARDIGIIESKELYNRISSTLNTVSSLPMWNGHLYNWYDTRTLDVIGTPFISTVDSGNFITSLVTLINGLKNYAGENVSFVKLIVQADKIVKNADFLSLYNKKRKLLSIGYDKNSESLGDACYDIFMSESRSTLYYVIASGQIPCPRETWRKMRRPLISHGGYIGLLSWTGTMFEYFMPALLLPIKYGSMSHQALYYALNMQVSKAIDGIWGISESCYYTFDGEMNYQYKAFGAQELALKSGMDKDIVISPYSSFLTLSIAPQKSIINLRKLEKLGMYGKYGFYESVDYTKTRVGKGHALIRTCMAHHIGMSIVAIDNAINSNIMQKRFMEESNCTAAQTLLEERIPDCANLYKNKLNNKTIKRNTNFNYKNTKNNSFNYNNSVNIKNNVSSVCFDTAMLSNNKFYMIASYDGRITLYDGKTALTNPDVSDIRRSLSLYLNNGEKTIKLNEGNFIYSDNSVVYNKSSGDIKTETIITMHGIMSCLCIHIDVNGTAGNICPMLYFEPVLAAPKDYNAHPMFWDLSVEASYSADENILYYRRRPRGEKDPDRYLAVSFLGGSIEFEINRDVLPFMYTSEDIMALCGSQMSNREGGCIIPVCAVQKKSFTKKGKYSCDFIIASAFSKKEASQIIKYIRFIKKENGKIQNEFIKSISSVTKSRIAISGGYMDYSSDRRYATYMLACLRYELKNQNDKLPADYLWKYGISADLPIIVLSFSDNCFINNESLCNNSIRIASGFISAHRMLMIGGVRFDVVFLYNETNVYGEPKKNILIDLIKSLGSESILQRKGGIFILPNENQVYDNLNKNSRILIDLNKDTVFSEIYNGGIESYKKLNQNNKHITKITAYGGYKTGFSENEFIINKDKQRVPWSYIYCNSCFGTLVTQSSAGFSWFRNANQGRLTKWNGDILLGGLFEVIIAELAGSKYDLCAVSSSVRYNRGCAVYEGFIGSQSNVKFTVKIGVDRKLPVKLIVVSTSVPCEIKYEIKKETSEYAQNLFLYKPCSGCFLLGWANNIKAREFILEKYKSESDIENEFELYKQNVNESFCGIKINTNIKSIDEMMNFYLPYQTYYSRMLARTGFYQVGGAYGFRDQLQDCLGIIYHNPKKVFCHIIRCASRQYENGDVMHWWHEGNQLRGIRTKCSDDMLWLPYVTSEYVKQTNDYSILKINVNYINSLPLQSSLNNNHNNPEKERYESPKKSNVSENIYNHCVRAILYACDFGSHGLPKIGSGDWNDGFNNVGANGKGESVWLAFFLRLVLKSFIPVCEYMEDISTASKLYEIEKNININTERHAWEGDRYIRGYYDNGFPLGSNESVECTIDALPQAFSALVNGITLNSEKAVDTAYEKLFDRENGIYKLFENPFNFRHINNPGYIRGYVPGVRENGGQYTHAAVWAAWGLIKAGRYDRAFEILDAINPAQKYFGNKTNNKDKNDKAYDIYRAEPYALAGDVYSNQNFIGRAGWTLYTGAAAWYYKIMLEEVLGYIEIGSGFTISPHLPSEIKNYTISINKYDTVYELSINVGENSIYIMDGQIVNNWFPFDKSYHKCEITVEKNKSLV